MGRVEMTEEVHNINVSVDVHHQEVSEEEDSRVLEKVAEEGDVQEVERRLMKQLQSPPQVCLERFSFDRSLRVLLAEDDDLTRHFVSAILQKCGYEVTPAENGPRAWKILEDLTSQIDLVLTEVTMPCLSGVELLSNIMSHGTFRSIPVVMMSSNDSMNIVLECLSKGAVDYLVKPIRKNELKNLWQHVWRRCLSSSNSGGGSGVTQKATKSRSFEDLGMETSSKNEDDIRSIGLNSDGSDDYSGTQSSWTKMAAELDSPGPTSPWDQPAYQIGSTSVQVMHPQSEMLGSKCVALSAEDECKGQDDTHATAPAAKDSDGRPPYLSCEELNREAETHNGVIYSEKTFGKNCTKEDEWQEEKHLENNSEKLHGDSVELPIGFIAKSTDPQKTIKITDMLSGLSKLSGMENTAIVDAMYMPSVELTLSGPQDVKETNDSSHNRNMFWYSNLSAFSRYGSVSTSNEGTTGNVCSCSPGENSSDAAKAKSEQNHRSLSNNTQTNPGSYGSNNDNMCSTTNIAPKRTAEFSEIGKSAFMSFQPSSAFLPTVSCLQPIQLSTNALAAAGKILSQPRGIDQETKELHHHHHYDHYPYVFDKPLVKQQDNRDNTSLQCGSYDVSGGAQIEGDTGNYHGSNGHMGCSVEVNPNWRNMETDNKAGETSEANGGTGEGVGPGQNHFSNRETALNRYRQKKNERCFKKKVRYHNRKKLAEQRPRIRGQFVRKGGETSKEKDKAIRIEIRNNFAEQNAKSEACYNYPCIRRPE